MTPHSENHFFSPFISTNQLVSVNFENMRFLGPHSASEGPHQVPISLKIGSPSGPHFEKSGSPGLVGTVLETEGGAVRVLKLFLKKSTCQPIFKFQGGALNETPCTCELRKNKDYRFLDWFTKRFLLDMDKRGVVMMEEYLKGRVHKKNRKKSVLALHT